MPAFCPLISEEASEITGVDMGSAEAGDLDVPLSICNEVGRKFGRF